MMPMCFSFLNWWRCLHAQILLLLELEVLSLVFTQIDHDKAEVLSMGKHVPGGIGETCDFSRVRRGGIDVTVRLSVGDSVYLY